MTRAEHLAWCKQRALEYLSAGDCKQAISSMLSDLRKWEGGPMYDSDLLSFMAVEAMMFRQGPADVRKWIEGFN